VDEVAVIGQDDEPRASEVESTRDDQSRHTPRLGHKVNNGRPATVVADRAQVAHRLVRSQVNKVGRVGPDRGPVDGDVVVRPDKLGEAGRVHAVDSHGAANY